MAVIDGGEFEAPESAGLWGVYKGLLEVKHLCKKKYPYFKTL